MLENANFEAHNSQNNPNCNWRPGSARNRWGSLQRFPRPLAVWKEGRGKRWKWKKRV